MKTRVSSQKWVSFFIASPDRLGAVGVFKSPLGCSCVTMVRPHVLITRLPYNSGKGQQFRRHRPGYMGSVRFNQIMRR